MMNSQKKRARGQNRLSEKALTFFEFLEEKEINGVLKKFYKCKLNKCVAQVNGSNPHNLVSHLMHVHREQYDEIAGKKR